MNPQLIQAAADRLGGASDAKLAAAVQQADAHAAALIAKEVGGLRGELREQLQEIARDVKQMNREIGVLTGRTDRREP